ncbi:Protein RRP5 [Portunus trituberculatus]|uniref:Protein RRP5 n=1 Tax=Portunus trituberculatus TaxID=210409 RepID=A0A5B7GGR2_PORTR|nr:Protein RRP5 [Portunus trituberculatus]
MINLCFRSATDPEEEPKTGDILREKEIYRTSSSGIYVKLSSNSRGFCSGNHLSDKSKVLHHIIRDYPVGKKITCRLMKYNYMDQLFIVSLQKSVLEQQFVTYREMKSGQVVQATVIGYDDVGAKLAISKRITGHVPFLHLANDPVKQPKLKHVKGDHVTARILKVDWKKHHLLLTLKPRLVNANEPILTEYTEEAENMVTVGYIIKIMPVGLLIGMFNDVKGFAPKSQLGLQSKEDLNVVFEKGQVVQCKILKVYPEKKNIILSLLVDGDRDEKNRPMLTSALKDNLTNGTQSSLQVLYSYLKDEEMVARGFQESQEKFAKFRIGDKVVALVTEVTDQKVHVSINNKTVEGKITGDHQPAKAALKVGQKVKACVLYVNQEEKSLELTLKPSLMLNIHVNKNEKLKIGMIVKCEVILAKEFFTMVVMKSECKGTVAYLPTVMHMNSFCPSLLSSVGKKCWMVVKHVEGPLVLGILKCHDKGEDFNLTSKLAQIAFTPCDEGEADSKSEEEEIDIEDNSNKDGQDMEDSETISEVLVDSSKEKTKKVIKKRQLETKETKTSKKVKTGNVVIPEQGDLNEEDSITNPVNESSVPNFNSCYKAVGIMGSLVHTK